MHKDQTYEDIKAEVLGGMSGYAASKKRGLPSLTYANRLANDPDIVAAKASGQIKSLARRHKTQESFSRLPHVRAVLEQGMTQTAAAQKFGISQPIVSRHVRLAQAEAPTTSAPQPTTTPPTTPPDLDILADIMRAYAKRLNMRPETLAHDMIHRLAD